MSFRLTYHCGLLYYYSCSEQRISKSDTIRGVAQFGRAPRSGRGGRKFESCRLDDWKTPEFAEDQ